MLTASAPFKRQKSYLFLSFNSANKYKSIPFTNLVSKISLSDGRTLSYSYDNEDRIVSVIDSIDGVSEYTYDALGQLTSETINGTTTFFTYDNYGNILSKGPHTYEYSDPVWKDLLTSFDGQRIEYDSQGNPVTYLGHTLCWEKGRQLKSFDNITYTYNANGIRTSKTVNGITHRYLLEGSKILSETWNGNVLTTLHNNEDSVCGIVYNGVPFLFQKNLQGDVIGIVGSDGYVVVRYSYDAWGKCTIVQDSSGIGISSINPYRYRGYYFDEDSSLYYLRSRYYNPIISRFVNADESKTTTIVSKVLATNIFAYCNNNAPNSSDPSGYLVWPGEIHRAVQEYLAMYILLNYGCYAEIEHFIRFSAFQFGSADLYVKSWNEIWEIKPEKPRYKKSGPSQLQKYLNGVPGSKPGRNLGTLTIYHMSSILYEVTIKSNSSDGMIYYDPKECVGGTALILLSAVAIVLVATGVGAVGVPALAGTLLFV